MSNISKINKTRKEKNISRLDQDFESLEKIGKGGYGIVLKGKHRLDKGIWAIKIIKLSNVDDKDDIVNEAITMTNIQSKHVVQYKTCWIEKNIGSAAKFFASEESDSNISESLNILSKSITITHSKFENSSIINEESDDDKNSVKKTKNYENYTKKINIDNNINNSEEKKKRKKQAK